MRTLAVVALLAAPAHADEGDADADLAARQPTAVYATLAGTTAKLTARFVLSLEGPRREDGQELAIPAGSIVTGGTAYAGGVAHRLQLEARDKLATRFDELSAAPASSDRRWGLKIDSESQTSVTIDVAVPHSTRVVLDVELDLPTCFDHDSRYAAIPVEWQHALDHKVQRGDRTVPCLGEGPWIAFPSRELAERPAGDQRIDGIAGRLPLDDRHIAHVELDLSREISEVPQDLYTAIVIDASRSLDDNEVEAQRAIVESYLREAPNSHVQLIAYARRARALLPGWTNASQALPRVDRELRALAGRNGSNIDVALGEAARWLSSVDGTRRIVVFSDELLAQRLLDASPLALRRGLSDDTLVHVVALANGTGALSRADDAVLAPLALATFGIAVRGGLDDDGNVDAKLLVRPISLDHIKLHSAGWNELANMTQVPCADDTALAEGSSCSWWGQGDASSGPITIEGVVWGRRFTRILRPDPAKALALARTLSATTLDTAELQLEVDRAARAVNSVWSVASIWGGPGGYGDVDSIGRGRSLDGFGGSHDIGSASDVGIGIAGASPRGTIHEQLAGAVASCRPGAANITITLETTRQEIVDVDVTVADLPSTTSRVVHDCLDEAVWNTILSIPNAPDHATIPITFTAGADSATSRAPTPGRAHHP